MFAAGLQYKARSCIVFLNLKALRLYSQSFSLMSGI